MGFIAHLPPATLRPFVAKAYGYVVAPQPTGIHRGLPSRHATLVIELGTPLTVSGLGGTVRAHCVVAGLHTHPAVIDSSRPQEGLQYALTPLGLRVLLGVPTSEVQGLSVDLVDVMGAPAADLIDALHTTAAWAERFSLVDAALLRGLQAADPADVHLAPEVRQAWHLIFVDDGLLRVGEVAARVGWSRRHLTERFRISTGLTPMEAIRVGRFEATRESLMVPRPQPLSTVAADCGYADQAHMAREWRAMAGCTMGTWLREELPFLQDSPLLEAADSLS